MRADLSTRLCRVDEALAAYDAAIARTDNAAEQQFLRARRARLDTTGPDAADC